MHHCKNARKLLAVANMSNTVLPDVLHVHVALAELIKLQDSTAKLASLCT